MNYNRHLRVVPLMVSTDIYFILCFFCMSSLESRLHTTKRCALLAVELCYTDREATVSM